MRTRLSKQAADAGAYPMRRRPLCSGSSVWPSRHRSSGTRARSHRGSQPSPRRRSGGPASRSRIHSPGWRSSGARRPLTTWRRCWASCRPSPVPARRRRPMSLRSLASSLRGPLGARTHAKCSIAARSPTCHSRAPPTIHTPPERRHPRFATRCGRSCLTAQFRRGRPVNKAGNLGAGLTLVPTCLEFGMDSSEPRPRGCSTTCSVGFTSKLAHAFRNFAPTSFRKVCLRT